MVGAGVRVGQRHAKILADLPLVPDGCAEGPRVLEVLVEDENPRSRDGAGGHRVREQFAVGRRAGAARAIGHAAGPVGAAAGRQVQARDARVIEPRVSAEDLSARPVGVVGHAQPGLEHLPVGRDRPIGRKREAAPRVGHRRVVVDRVVGLVFRRDQTRLDLRLPPEPVVHGPPPVRLPGILQVHRQLVLWNGLRTCLTDAAVDARLLQVQQRPARRGVGEVGEEVVHRGKDVSAVREPDEGLHRVHPVPLGAELDQVVTLGDRHVVEHLDASVVVIDGQEERQAETKSAAEVHPRVGERPTCRRVRGVGTERRGSCPAVGARAVLSGVLEAELVRHSGRQIRRERQIARIRMVLLDPVGAAAPGVDVERAVVLLGPGVVVLE